MSTYLSISRFICKHGSSLINKNMCKKHISDNMDFGALALVCEKMFCVIGTIYMETANEYR